MAEIQELGAPVEMHGVIRRGNVGGP
jgi:hypothetical protein